VVFGVIIGTGTGGGLVVDGRLLNGPHSITGEWGHNPLPWWSEDDGRPDCYCGKQACIETFLSGPGHSYHDQMARSLAQLINILDPDAIVLGGGMSNIDTIYTAVANRLGDYLFSDFVATPLLKATRGDSSGVYGAAFLWE
jgi:fructokinase